MRPVEVDRPQGLGEFFALTGEEAHLRFGAFVGFGAAGFRHKGRLVLRVDRMRLEARQYGLGALDDPVGDAGELGDVDAVGLVRAARNYFMMKRYVPLPLATRGR